MTDAFTPLDHFARLDLPAQDLDKLTFCGSNKTSRVQEWVNQLQATRITHTGMQLYKNLPEINRLETDPKTRLAMLEAFRPSVQNAIAGLAQQFLGQPLILPESAQKTAIVAQALQRNIANGYSICVRDLISQKNLNALGRENLATALYRAIFSIGSLYLRTCQIYTHLTPGWWLHLHHLFRIATHFQLAHTPVPDPLLNRRASSTIHECYLRAVMLACSSPNQLSQQDLEFAFAAFENWAHLMAFSEEVNPDNNNPFVINLSRDEPPTYKERINGDEHDFLLEPDFSTLLRALDRQRESAKGEIAVPQGMSSELLEHLRHAWRTTKDRQQHRHQVRTVVDVCVGLTECHYHMAGETDFTTFTSRSGGTKEHGWSEPADYVSSSSFTPADRKSRGTGASPYPLTRVNVQNISAGGYCLYWQDKVPVQATAGQLLGIRDAGQKEWHLGVVRWVRQLRGASQMGVQILAVDAEPAAASLMYDMGGYSDAMRVFMVPAGLAGQAAPTLITAAAPFQAFSRLRLISPKQTSILKLDQSVFASNKIRQFRYQVTGTEARAPSAQPVPGGDFDSEWE